jgi:hypothetical protein
MTVASGGRAGERAAAPGPPVEAAVDPAPRVAETRQERLADLARELESRGLRHRLLGVDGSVLRVIHPATGHAAMILATPATPAGKPGWSYLWSGGGVADAADPARAAEEIARRLA